MELGIWVLVTLVLWFTLDIPLIYCLAIVAIAWIMIKGGGIGNAFNGIKNAVGGVVDFTKRLIIFVPVFLGMTLIMTLASGISPHNATRRLQVLGPMPWNWHSNPDMPLVLFVCLMFLVTMASVKVAYGDWKLALKIFGGSASILIVILYLPKTREAMGPTTLAGPDGADEKIAKEGVVAPVVKGAGTLLAGQPDDLKKRGLVGSSYHRAKEYLFGEEPPPTPPPPAAPPVAPPTQKQVRRLYLFTDNDTIAVKIHLGEVDFYPKGGEVLITPPSPLKSWLDKPGTINPRREFPPGVYTVKRVDPGATGIEIWN
ncbi:hypothetical protein IT399_01510 [Candidatus Nomurabacteria bacterium]|nr:hypothetical protein [Candidatus Nomurabacteria bacterium]